LKKKYQELKETVKKSNDTSEEVKELKNKQVAPQKQIIRSVQKSHSYAEIAQKQLKMEQKFAKKKCLKKKVKLKWSRMFK
jgi:hypothetical protein